MTDTYLRSLGFAPVRLASRGPFSQAWRYRFDHDAFDGTSLFIEHPLGIDACRVSSVASPLTSQEVFANVGLHDKPALEVAIKAFYAAHGGMGTVVPAAPTSAFRPFHRAL